MLTCFIRALYSGFDARGDCRLVVGEMCVEVVWGVRSFQAINIARKLLSTRYIALYIRRRKSSGHQQLPFGHHDISTPAIVLKIS